MLRKALFIFLFLAAGCSAGQQAGDNIAKTQDFVLQAKMDSVCRGLTGYQYGSGKVCGVCRRQFDDQARSCPYDGAQLKDIR